MNIDGKDDCQPQGWAMVHRFAVRLGLWVLTLGMVGCAWSHRVPTAIDLRTRQGRPRAVVLVRVVTEIDGRPNPAFPSSLPQDSLGLAWGDFSSGGRLREAPRAFLSRETRKDGWTYLLLEPGIHYLGVNTPQNGNAFSYAGSWRGQPPRWRLEVPAGANVVYAGTLFVPGRGSALIFGGRRMRQFAAERFEIRDETRRAEDLHGAWLRGLGPLTTRLVRVQPASEPLSFETPPGR